jgi:hypothetical protein
LCENGDGIDVALQNLLEIAERAGDPEPFRYVGQRCLIEVAAGHLLHEWVGLEKRNETAAEKPHADQAEFEGFHGWKGGGYLTSMKLHL